MHTATKDNSCPKELSNLGKGWWNHNVLQVNHFHILKASN